MNRKEFLRSISLMASTSLFAPQILHAASKTKTFFRLQEINGRWWFMTPDGKKFWSLGINHFDSATLRYEESGNVWEEKYRNSMKRLSEIILHWL